MQIARLRDAVIQSSKPMNNAMMATQPMEMDAIVLARSRDAEIVFFKLESNAMMETWYDDNNDIQHSEINIPVLLYNYIWIYIAKRRWMRSQLQD